MACETFRRPEATITTQPYERNNNNHHHHHHHTPNANVNANARKGTETEQTRLTVMLGGEGERGQQFLDKVQQAAEDEQDGLLVDEARAVVCDVTY
mgnify:CR=1 FL=1